MKRSTRIYGCLVLLIALFYIPTSVKSQSSTERYLYLMTDSRGNGLINWVDPISLKTAMLVDLSELLPNTGIFGAFLSPNGEWIVLETISSEVKTLILLDLNTFETFNVIDSYNLLQAPRSHGTNLKNFAWSPNSQYFAFHLARGQGQTTYLYDLTTNTLSHLGADGRNQYNVSWSADSQYLAVFSFTCNPSICERIAIDVYNAQTTAMDKTIDLTYPFRTNNASEANELCELQWSRNNQYLSFLGFCTTAVYTRQELYLVDLSTTEITQITNFTPSDFDDMNSIFILSASSLWIENEQLLIGLHTNSAASYSDDISSSASTMIYDANEDVLSELDHRRLTHWTYSSSVLGYSSYDYINNSGEINLERSIEIGEFDGESIVTLASGPAGCNASLNQQGDIVAYVEQFGRAFLCPTMVNGLNFLDRDGLRIFTAEKEIFALGWSNLSSFAVTLPDPTVSPP